MLPGLKLINWELPPNIVPAAVPRASGIGTGGSDATLAITCHHHQCRKSAHGSYPRSHRLYLICVVAGRLITQPSIRPKKSCHCCKRRPGWGLIHRPGCAPGLQVAPGHIHGIERCPNRFAPWVSRVNMITRPFGDQVGPSSRKDLRSADRSSLPSVRITPMWKRPLLLLGKGDEVAARCSRPVYRTGL